LTASYIPSIPHYSLIQLHQSGNCTY